MVPQAIRRTSTLKARVSYEGLATVGFSTQVEKPLGIVFGENSDPYSGLVVDEVDPDMNASAAGLKIGDQLLAVNGESVVGGDFESVMNTLKNAPTNLELKLYRGSVRTLFTVLDNMKLFEEEEEDGDVAVVMDENYESPVRIEVVEEKPLTAGDVFNAFKKIGSTLTEKRDAPPKQEKKGLFGGMFSGETIQLDGDDASGLKRQKKNLN